MSSQPAEIPVGLAPEPPVSLPTPEAAEAPAHEAAGPVRPPLEAQLVQQGKLSMGQLAQAHRDRLEKGGSILDIVVERGWVGADDVAALRAEHGIDAPAPAPAVVPAPVVQAAPEPAPRQPAAEETPEPEPAPEAPPEPDPFPPAASYKVAIRLTNGELIVAGQADGAAGAEILAQAVVADLSTHGESWPRFHGRYLRPETILSVDIIPG